MPCQIDRSVVSSRDDDSLPSISSSNLLIATSTRYTNIPPQPIASRIAPSRTAVRVIFSPARQVSIPQFIALSWNPKSPYPGDREPSPVLFVSPMIVALRSDHKRLLLWLSGLQKCSTRMKIIAKSNTRFVYLSPSVKMLSTTDLAPLLPEVSAPYHRDLLICSIARINHRNSANHTVRRLYERCDFRTFYDLDLPGSTESYAASPWLRLQHRCGGRACR
jgi:hypothetical protein